MELSSQRFWWLERPFTGVELGGPFSFFSFHFFFSRMGGGGGCAAAEQKF